MQTPEAIEAARQALGNWVWVLLKIGLFAGALSMAIIQMFKDFSPLRNIFQRLWLRGWLEEKAESAPQINGVKVDASGAEKTLVQLATAGDRRALYNLPVEQLCGQIVAAMQAALDSPSAYSDLVYCLGQGTAAPPPTPPGQRGSETASRPELDLELIRKPPTEAMRKSREMLLHDERSAKQVEAYTAARNRVLHQVQRAVDSLQIALGRLWKKSLQVAALTLSVVIAALIARYAGQTFGVTLGVALASGLIGGFFAPILRDVLAALQSFRR